ncbi:methylation-associated defense system protein MAD4 [Vibrio owensii]|uniref:methylation-associated defense system protein MAD4 n=1 Tax=Vibrio owensii TaxID=696485 RepID=UPI00406908CE
MRDLVCLVADNEMEAAVRGFFDNPAHGARLGCRDFSFNPQGDLIKHPRHDAGVCNDGHNMLKLYLATHQHALIMLDKECELGLSADQMRQRIQDNMVSVGWPVERFHIFVIDPELEVLAWQENTCALERAVGYREAEGTLRQWISAQGYWPQGEECPQDPKAALDHTIHSNVTGRRKARSVVFRSFAENVSLRHCTNNGFGVLRTCLQGWFMQEWNAA